MRRFAPRFGRFGLVGLMGAVVQLTLLSLLTKFGMIGIVATPVAVEIAILHNFIWHERFTWRDHGSISFRKRTARLWRFHAANGLISLVGNTMLMHCLVTRFQVPTLPAAMGAIAFCSLANFFAANHWVYALRDRAVPVRLHTENANASVVPQ
jgi:dolichol-phosphate mannosyltransferase